MASALDAAQPRMSRLSFDSFASVMSTSLAIQFNNLKEMNRLGKVRSGFANASKELVVLKKRMKIPADDYTPPRGIRN